MNEEIWKYIETSKDYMISNRGRVKSFVKNKDGSILKQDTGNSGYKRVMIKYPEPRAKHLVHRLVATAFIENVDNKPIINPNVIKAIGANNIKPLFSYPV